jgi:murein DD-endopeptidase MepM/ murein hydrolase activator NlpD
MRDGIHDRTAAFCLLALTVLVAWLLWPGAALAARQPTDPFSVPPEPDAPQDMRPADAPPWDEPEEEADKPGPCPTPESLTFYPVRGRHDTGFQRQPPSADRGGWSCHAARSNSDFRGAGCSGGACHFGIDIWAPEGTPVVAAVSGKIVQAANSIYSGNHVTIRDGCGWYHYAIHLRSLAEGIEKGAAIQAGQVIGYVGRSGSASRGVVHLHYSIYPGPGRYRQGIDPHSRLRPVERNVCFVPRVAPARLRSAAFPSGSRAGGRPRRLRPAPSGASQGATVESSRTGCACPAPPA